MQSISYLELQLKSFASIIPTQCGFVVEDFAGIDRLITFPLLCDELSLTGSRKDKGR